MIRATLDECIKLFNNSDSSMRGYAIRGMEELHEWETAAIYWNKIGDYVNEKICRIIIKSNNLGDCYRRDTKELNEWADKTVEEGIMTREEAAKVIYSKLNEIYKKYYNSDAIDIFK